ncbi:phosphotransferase enzyme family protein [Fusarium austroafricanum]|uniref:Phosphotransferase enzyme family protein n=1 Tax=Fusarium austroafricanum TaxID=2364996 RepID=A0A8H4JK82_9HYPO|nr:phosphotransferase enzyme family protein [Fusarium austroafricanum]
MRSELSRKTVELELFALNHLQQLIPELLTSEWDRGPFVLSHSDLRPILRLVGKSLADLMSCQQHNAVRAVKLSKEGNREAIVIDDDDDDDFKDWEDNDALGQSPEQSLLEQQQQQQQHSQLQDQQDQRAMPADGSMEPDPSIPPEVQVFRNETNEYATKLANNRRDFQTQVSVVEQEIQLQVAWFRAERDRLADDRRPGEERRTAEA